MLAKQRPLTSMALLHMRYSTIILRTRIRSRSLNSLHLFLSLLHPTNSRTSRQPLNDMHRLRRRMKPLPWTISCPRLRCRSSHHW